MKKLALSVLLLFSSFSFAKAQDILFLQTASQGSLTYLSNNNYLLSIKNTPDFVSYFTDRPVRKAGVISNQEFLSLWNDKHLNNNFSENPPNAAIVLVSDKGTSESFVAIVSNPGFVDGTLSYQINILSKKAIKTGKLSHIAMFFDHIHWNPGGF